MKELLEKRNEASQGMIVLRDKIKDDKRAFTAEERTNFDKASADYDALTEKIDAVKRANDVEANMDAIRPDIEKADHKAGITSDDKDVAFRGWVRNQALGVVNDNEKLAMEKCNINAFQKELILPMARVAPTTLAEARALQKGTDSEGGYTVPEGFSNKLEIALLKYGVMRQVADIMRTATGIQIPWPTVNDTGNEGVLVAEEGSIATDTDPVFAEVVFNAYKYSSKIIKISSELLEDSAFDMAGYLGSAIGERLGRALNTACTTGDGSSKPNGIVTASTSQDTAGSGAFIADDLIDLQFALEDSYDEDASFMMNKLVLKAVRKFKDTDNHYLWEPSYRAGDPETILGKPVVRNTKMASTITAGDKIALYGDFKKYKIREVNGIRMKRLVELYAGNDQEGFGGFMRFDGDLLDAGTVPVRLLTVKA